MLAVVLLCATGPAVANDGASAESERSQRIDAHINDRLQATSIPGASVAVVRGGDTVHLAGYGKAGPVGDPVTADTPFLIGSVSKPFTAIAVFQLVHEGRINLGDPVGPYLEPTLGDDADAFEGMTIEHLLNHRSGMPMTLGLPGTAPVRTADDALQRRVADLARAHAPERAPGQAYEYSNANYILLAAVVEQVTGEAFADYLRERVFDPLAMTASFATNASPRAEGLATGHEAWFGLWRPSDQPYDPAGAAMGYMGSTARDLAAFLDAQLSGHEALPVSAVEVVDRQATPTGWDVPLERSIVDGWFIDEVAGHRTVSHAGSIGDYAAHVIMVPGADLGIAVMQNASAFIAAGHEGQYALSLGLLDLLLDVESERSAPSPVMTVFLPALAWGLGVLVIANAVRYLVRGRARAAASHASWRFVAVREVGPVLAYLGLGLLALVLVPLLAGVRLETAQIFYPDLAWGLVFTGYAAIGWSVARVALRVWAVFQSRSADHQRPAG